jgi:hypothetical protein
MSDRKYKQRGYMEEERREEQRPAPSGPREKPEGPRGRGLGAPSLTVFRCRVCGVKQQLVGVLSLEATCSACGADLHTCSNCLHFDGSRPNECRKPVLQGIANKTKRNACQLFAPKTVQEFAPESEAAAAPGGLDARSAFDALFKKN